MEQNRSFGTASPLYHLPIAVCSKGVGLQRLFVGRVPCTVNGRHFNFGMSPKVAAFCVPQSIDAEPLHQLFGCLNSTPCIAMASAGPRDSVNQHRSLDIIR